MRKKIYVLVIAVMISSLSLMGCGKIKEEASAAVQAYNDEAEVYNESIAPYNEAVEKIVNLNAELSTAINEAQDAINKGEEPFDPETITSLKNAMSTAQDAKVEEPVVIDTFEILSLTENMKTSDMKALIERANSDAEKISTLTVPEVPEIPDYTDIIKSVQKAQKTYENSIQSLKQVTAPTDDFVMERLQQVDTITKMDAVTEDHDPNGKLGKQGGYIGCIYFRDSQVDRSQLYVDGDPNDVIDVGTDGGGALEIFSTAEDAKARDDYLGSYDGTMYASGSHYVVGTILVRTSNELSGTQQKKLTDKITKVLIKVK